MGMEGYIPTPEEFAEAEAQLSPEQKIQSDAHEEGYKLGEEQNKNVLHFELEEPGTKKFESNEEKTIEKQINFSIHFNNTNKFKVAVSTLCLQNETDCILQDLGKVSPTNFGIKVSFKGTKENILKVLDGLRGYY